MANVGVLVDGMEPSVTYHAHQALLDPIAPMNVIATMMLLATLLMGGVNAKLALLAHVVKNFALKVTGAKIVIELASVKMLTLSAIQCKVVFVVQALQV